MASAIDSIREDAHVRTLGRRTHDFGRSVAVDEVEDLLRAVGPEVVERTEWLLDMAACCHVDPGAGFRLGNALRLWATGRVIVVVPERHVEGDVWFRAFTRSGHGLAITRHADTVCSGGEDVTVAVQGYYVRRAERSSTNYAVVPALEDGAIVPSKERFATTVTELLRRWLPHALTNPGCQIVVAAA